MHPSFFLPFQQYSMYTQDSSLQIAQLSVCFSWNIRNKMRVKLSDEVIETRCTYIFFHHKTRQCRFFIILKRIPVYFARIYVNNRIGSRWQCLIIYLREQITLHRNKHVYWTYKENIYLFDNVIATSADISPFNATKMFNIKIIIINIC